MKITPYRHQLEVAEMAKTASRIALFDPPGAGKTLSGILAAKAWDVHPDRLLVVCEANKVLDWREELALHYRDPVLVLTYQKFTNRVRKHVLLPSRYDAIIVDEAHAVKTKEAKRTLAMRAFLIYSKNAIFLTGTPFTSAPMQTYHVLLTLMGGKFELSEDEFRARYCVMAKRGFAVRKKNGDRTFLTVPFIADMKNLADFRERCKKFVMRRTQDELNLSLPPMMVGHHKIKFTAPEADGLKKYAGQVGGNVARVDRFIGLMKVSYYVDYIADFLRSYPEEGPVLIATKHRDVAYAYHEHLAGADFKCAVITGDQSAETRSRIIEETRNGKYRCLIFTMASAGTGLNMQFSNRMFLAETGVSLGQFLQTMHRIHRIKQERKCYIDVCVCNMFDRNRLEQIRKKSVWMDNIA